VFMLLLPNAPYKGFGLQQQLGLWPVSVKGVSTKI